MGVPRKVPYEERVIELLEKDRHNLEAAVKYLREELHVFDSMEVAVKREIDKERKKVEAMIHKVEKLADSSLRHLIWLEARHIIYKKNLAKGLVPPEEEEPAAWYGLDAVLQVLFGISMKSVPRDTNWEVASFAFLLEAVLERTLTGDSDGYLVKKPIPGDKVRSLIEKGHTLLPEKREDRYEYCIEVKDLWAEFLLPEIYGGKDPYWEDDEFLPWEEAELWVKHPIYLDSREFIQRGKRNEI